MALNIILLMKSYKQIVLRICGGMCTTDHGPLRGNSFHWCNVLWKLDHVSERGAERSLVPPLETSAGHIWAARSTKDKNTDTTTLKPSNTSSHIAFINADYTTRCWKLTLWSQAGHSVYIKRSSQHDHLEGLVLCCHYGNKLHCLSSFCVLSMSVKYR